MSEAQFFGALLLLFGGASAAFPYRVSKFGEQMDAIGSKRRMDEVEPADWNVLLTRLLGAFFALLGVGMLLS